MKEEIVPGHIVIPDQFFDRTQGKRASTFFGNGVVGHVQFADPICGGLADILAADDRCRHTSSLTYMLFIGFSV